MSRLTANGPQGLIGWTESTADVDSLYVADHGHLVLTRSLARSDTLDWGYEGCHAHYLAWHAGRIVVGSTERGFHYLRSLHPDGSSEIGISCSWGYHIDGDWVFWLGHDPGLISAAALPTFETRPPLPLSGCPHGGEIQRELRALTLPNALQRAAFAPGGIAQVNDLAAQVKTRLFAPSPAPPQARLVIEALIYPFLRGPWSSLARYEPPPTWLPAYWHRYLNATGLEREAQDLLNLLDAIAQPSPPPEHGWNPCWTAQEGQIGLALDHVRRRAPILAAVCRTGLLPPGWHCLLFDPAPQSKIPGSRVNSDAYPPTLQSAFKQLAPTRPAPLAYTIKPPR